MGKHPGGRPPLYETAEEVQLIIDKYFNKCFVEKLDEDGNKLMDRNGDPVYIQHKPFTMSGLAFELGMTRQTLLDYSKKDEFSYTIMRARQIVEIFTEEGLFRKETVNGSKFSLINNFDRWNEKQKVEQTNTNLNIETYSEMSEDEINKQLQEKYGIDIN